MEWLDLAQRVTPKQPYELTEARGTWHVDFDIHRQAFPPKSQRQADLHVVTMDFGAKRNILRCLVDVGCKVTAVPASTSAAEALALEPDGIFLSNGPGDPAAVTYAIAAVRDLLGQRPLFGICLGHQILGLALGGTTYKLRFGHHGGNQPVRFADTGRVEISSHNHGFAVDSNSL